MNKLTLHGKTFLDAEILSGNLTLHSALLCDELQADECVFTLSNKANARFLTSLHELFKTKNGEGVWIEKTEYDFADIQYGEEMLFEKDGAKYLFFVQSVKRVGRWAYEVVGTSTIGMLAREVYPGKVLEYNLVEDITDEIFGSHAYTIDADVGLEHLYGWIPYTDSRSALNQLLFAMGATVLRNADGTPRIAYPDTENVKQIPASRTSMGGSIELGEKVGRVELMEKSLFTHNVGTAASDYDAVLFDNTENGADAVDELIAFEQPFWSYAKDGNITVEFHETYMRVSGRGRVYGYAYSSNSRVLSADTGNGGAQTARSENCSLVTAANSWNVLQRLKSYYAESERITNEVALSDTLALEAGDNVSFVSPWNEPKQGIVESLSMPVSGILKAGTSIVCGWTPTAFGNAFSSDRRVRLTSDGTWTKPEGVKVLYVALIGGGQGGQAGYNGTAGGTAGTHKGGAGGKGGKGGTGGKVLVLTLEVPEEETTYTATIGAGGAGGASNGAAGSDGGATSFVGGTLDLTSADGTVPETAWADLFHGTAGTHYARNFSTYESAAGKDGGYLAQNTWHTAGYSFPDDETPEWYGGAQGATKEDEYYCTGGCGGGAAHGENGSNGGDASLPHSGGAGGAGANAGAPDDHTDWGYGSGGAGGYGGGGGGQGGIVMLEHTIKDNYQGAGGAGGLGGQGGAGIGGAVIIYY